MAANNYKLFGPPIMERDWFELLHGVANASSAEARQAVSVVVRDANKGVNTHGPGARVLSRRALPPCVKKLETRVAYPCCRVVSTENDGWRLVLRRRGQAATVHRLYG